MVGLLKLGQWRVTLDIGGRSREYFIFRIPLDCTAALQVGVPFTGEDTDAKEIECFFCSLTAMTWLNWDSEKKENSSQLSSFNFFLMCPCVCHVCISVCVCECMSHVCLCVSMCHICVDAHRGQKRASGALEMELQLLSLRAKAFLSTEPSDLLPMTLSFSSILSASV